MLWRQVVAKPFDERAAFAHQALYTAEASTLLGTTTLVLAEGDKPVKFAAGPRIKPRHSAAYWDKVTAGFDFSEADQVPAAQFNKALWTGLMGTKPYPALRGQAADAKDD